MSSIGTTISGMTGRGSIRHNNRDFIHEAGTQATGLYRAWTKTNRVEGLDGSGKGRSDGDCPAA